MVYNTGTDNKPLDSFGRPIWKIPSIAEYQMTKKEFERIVMLRREKLIQSPSGKDQSDNIRHKRR